jgi:hypothetical protein
MPDDPKTLFILESIEGHVQYHVAWESEDGTLVVFWKGNFGNAAGIVVDNIRREKSIVVVHRYMHEVDSRIVRPVTC